MAFSHRANKTVCAKCGDPIEKYRLPKYYYCLKCQMEYVRKSAAKTRYGEYSEKRKIQHNCRVAVFQAVKSGKLVKMPCEVCGFPVSEAHHEDYSKPLQVKWLCREHHNNIHSKKPHAKKPKPKKSALPEISGDPVAFVLRQILRREIESYGIWEEKIKPTQMITRQRQVERKFKGNIQALKTTIAILHQKREEVADFHVKKSA